MNKADTVVWMSDWATQTVHLLEDLEFRSLRFFYRQQLIQGATPRNLWPSDQRAVGDLLQTHCNKVRTRGDYPGRTDGRTQQTSSKEGSKNLNEVYFFHNLSFHSKCFVDISLQRRVRSENSLSLSSSLSQQVSDWYRTYKAGNGSGRERRRGFVCEACCWK